jgi:hypothetical protein
LLGAEKFAEIIWCYGVWQSRYKKIKARFIEGLPDLEEFDGRPKLVVIDDLMHEADERVSKLFTKISHHKNASVVFITQNVFHQKKNNRDSNLNCHYLVLFKNPRDSLQISYLSRQMNPSNPKLGEHAFSVAASKPHGYLLLDFKQDTPDYLRIRSDIFSKMPAVHWV